MNKLQNKVGAYKAEDFQLRIYDYLHLKGELKNVEFVMSDTLLYFLDVLTDKELDFALNQIKKDIIQKYKIRLFTYEYRINELENHRIERGSSVSFKSNLLSAIAIEAKYNLNESIWLIFDDITKGEFQEKHYHQRIWTYQKNNLYHERIKQIPINAKFVLASET